MGGKMDNAIICHGVKLKDAFDKMEIPFCASYWYPWLQQKLILAGVPTQVPSFTNSWLPARSYAADVEHFIFLFDFFESQTYA